MARSPSAAAGILDRYNDVLYEYYFRGAGNPDDAPYWEQRYAAARKRMISRLMKEEADA